MSAPILAQHTGRIRYHIEPYEFDADAPRYRGTPTPGTLWERASYEATLTPSSHGWLMAYYVIGRHPHAERFGPANGFATFEEAEAWLSADTPAAKLARWEYARVQAGLYFTKSGRIVKWPHVTTDTPTTPTTPEEA